MFDNDDEFVDNIEENLQQVPKNTSKKKKIIIISSIIIVVIVIIIIVALVVRNSLKNRDRDDKGNENDQIDLTYEISTANFSSEIKYVGSHYNYQGDLLVIYQKNDPKSYFVGIANDKGEILNEVREIKENEVETKYLTYIGRASSFDDGKRVLIAGKILECTKELKQCNNAKLYDLEFPEELVNMETLWYVFTEPIINYGGKYIFWSTFDKDVNIMNFVGELNFTGDKYVIQDVKGISNYFYDLYDKNNGSYTLPKILRFGPIKQVLECGKALSIGGFLNYGLRKGIYQSLLKDDEEQLTFFEGYDETTAISPDSKLACVMTTRFSEKTSFEIVGLIPTPYSILVSYLISIDVMKYCVSNLRNKKEIQGNLGPALVELSKVKEDKNYKGINLNTNGTWVFNGFISWSPDGKKIMFDEMDKNSNKRRCQIVRLKNYKPSEIKFEDNFPNDIPYSRNITETINLHLDYPINITVNGKSGYLEIFREKTKCKIKYNNFSEDNEIFYDGDYSYEKTPNKDSIYQVNITSEGKKNGNCLYRLWFDGKSMILFDKDNEGKNKTYGSCNYENKTIDVNIYNYEI